MDVESEQEILLTKKYDAKTCKLSHTIIMMIISMILVGLLSNIDRMIDAFEGEDYSDSTINQYDTIIVGGGPAGMLQLHLLQKYKPNDYKVLLLEQLGRVGGRTFTSHISNKQTNSKIFIEHGAMRCKYNHIFIMKILKYLDMCHELIPFSHYNTTTHDPLYSYRGNIINEKNNAFQNNSYWIDTYNLNEFEIELINNNNNINYVYQYI
eukprot:532705_1